MKKEDQDALKYAINHDLAAITFGMVKSRKYSENDIQDIFAYIAVDKVNFARNNNIELTNADLTFVLECTYDFIKNLAGGRIDDQLRNSVSQKFYELLKLQASTIEAYKNSVFNSVRPFIK
jgi:hypothetical protein